MMSLTSEMRQQERNWLDLPADVTKNILNRIGIVDILENAQKVCTDWRKICKDPVLWRVINMNELPSSILKLSIENLCKHAMDRSQGQLVDITLVNDYNAELFLYAADRSSQLRRLELSCYFNHESLTKDAFMKFPLLEELNLYAMEISQDEIETVCRYCPMLKILKVNNKVPAFWKTIPINESSLKYLNAMAISIGQNLVELRHLELIANKMTNHGLHVILDNCHHLETLDLRQCLNIDLNGDLDKKCSEQIKHLKLPKDSLEGCPYLYQLRSELEDYYDYEYYDYIDEYIHVYDPDYFSY